MGVVTAVGDGTTQQQETLRRARTLGVVDMWWDVVACGGRGWGQFGAVKEDRWARTYSRQGLASMVGTWL